MKKVLATGEAFDMKGKLGAVWQWEKASDDDLRKRYENVGTKHKGQQGFRQ